jgi:regulation of enolase protein 1 (concanavalin A-like superfamily)
VGLIVDIGSADWLSIGTGVAYQSFDFVGSGKVLITYAGWSVTDNNGRAWSIELRNRLLSTYNIRIQHLYAVRG